METITTAKALTKIYSSGEMETLIGLASVLLMALTGHIAGISGIFGGCLTFAVGDTFWRFAFIVVLILAPAVSALLGYRPDNARYAGKLGDDLNRRATGRFWRPAWRRLHVGHGVCGIARLSVGGQADIDSPTSVTTSCSRNV